MLDQPTIDNAIVQLDILVHWGDMDAALHVNNTVYHKWVESVRIAFFERLLGESPKFHTIGPILAWQDCKFIFPVTFPDTVITTYDVTELGQQYLMCKAKVYSKQHQRIVAIAHSKLVPYDYKGLHKVDVPDLWAQPIVEFYGEGIRG